MQERLQTTENDEGPAAEFLLETFIYVPHDIFVARCEAEPLEEQELEATSSVSVADFCPVPEPQHTQFRRRNCLILERNTLKF
jgi:hypothetical protein